MAKQRPFIKVVKKEIRNYTLTLGRLEFLQLFHRAGMKEIPANAEITIQVPGGGDWSNEELSINSDVPIVVKWKEEVHVA